MSKPVILLCGFYKNSVLQMPLAYINAVLQSGGIPFVAAPENKSIKEYIKTANGVVFIGGGDIKAELYSGNGEYDEDVDYGRDVFELDMVLNTLKNKIPILGICRGCQVINVALGGTLYENIAQHKKTEHTINVEKDSILNKCFNARKCEVNSYHHQACKILGKGLKSTAFSDDGYIEAFESTEFYCHGVQFHPERMISDKSFAEIFGHFINACT